MSLKDGAPLRIGVVGAGVMGSNHARVLMSLPGVTMVGIVDQLPAHSERATRLVGCPVFETLDELIAAGVDAVTVAAPTHLHHEVSLALIARRGDAVVGHHRYRRRGVAVGGCAARAGVW